MKYAKGIMWLDDCRIPFVDEGDNNTTRERYDTIGYGSKMNNGWGSMDDSAKQGRFTPNLLVCDDMLNDGNITGGKDFIITTENNDIINWGFKDTKNRKVKQDKGTNSRYYDLDKWFDKVISEL